MFWSFCDISLINFFLTVDASFSSFLSVNYDLGALKPDLSLFPLGVNFYFGVKHCVYTLLYLWCKIYLFLKWIGDLSSLPSLFLVFVGVLTLLEMHPLFSLSYGASSRIFYRSNGFTFFTSSCNKRWLKAYYQLILSYS
jgi:hypothetical protein